MPISDAGYSIAEDVFNRHEMARVSHALEAANLPRTKAGVRHVLRIQK